MNKLVETRQSLGQLTIDELADYMASTGVSSQNANTAQAEFLRRQTNSIDDTARATRSHSRYILSSVAVLALSSMLAAGALVYLAYNSSQATYAAQMMHAVQATQVTQVAPPQLVPPLPPALAPKKNGSIRP